MTTIAPVPMIRVENGVTYIRLSASSLGIGDRCLAALHMYKVRRRKPVKVSSGLIAGTAVHAAAPLWKAGRSVADQDAAIDAVLAETPIAASEKEYRTPAYIKDAWAAFRVELDGLFAHWTVDEMEQQGVIELGQVAYRPYNTAALAFGTRELIAHVEWEFRRDLVGVDPSGERWVVDWKTMAQDRETTVKAYANSGQFMGYLHSWRVQHPDKPVKGVQPIRLVMRKPSLKGKGVTYEIPKDGPVTFSTARLTEWVSHTLRKARDILERDPNDPVDWPLAQVELGCCSHQYGLCEYLPICLLDPHERPLRLSFDDFEDCDAGKNRDATNGQD